MTNSSNKVTVFTGGAVDIGTVSCRFLARDGIDMAIWERGWGLAAEIR